MGGWLVGIVWLCSLCTGSFVSGSVVWFYLCIGLSFGSIDSGWVVLVHLCVVWSWFGLIWFGVLAVIRSERGFRLCLLRSPCGYVRWVVGYECGKILTKTVL